MELRIAPRGRPPMGAESIQLEPPPQKTPLKKQPLLLTLLPSLTMALPMLLGFSVMYRANTRASANGSYMGMGLTVVVTSALLGSLWSLLNYRKRIQDTRFQERLRKRSYRNYLRSVEDCLREHVNYRENLLRNQAPELSELIDRKRRSITFLNESPSEILEIRLGIGNLTYEIPLQDADQFTTAADVLKREMHALTMKYGRLVRVPVSLFAGHGAAIRLTGERASDLAFLLTTVLIRICLTYRPQEVRIYVALKDRLLQTQTAWAHLLPHIIPPDEGIPASLPENGFLVAVVQQEASIKAEMKDDPRLLPVYVHPANQYQGGIYVSKTTRFEGLIDADGVRTAIALDRVSLQDAQLAARTLCRLRSGLQLKETGLPELLPITELLRDQSTEEAIASAWRVSDSTRTLSAPIGVRRDGSPLCLDAHEKGEGPHGLIAGMTGSGKSELLMTYILSLAVKYPPWEISFFLVDYKGGGMSQAFAGLPHVIGSISNLSGERIRRAFLSISAENERRQRLFLAAGVSHISEYRRSGQREALPHIFLIIDEFAQLKREEPEFMQELISLSRVGRSLGMHLILCTQKPGGSVDQSILTNSRFQIALRLADPFDSSELLHRPDAAYLTVPGRAILKVGADAAFETFQSAYTRAPAKGVRKEAVILTDAYGRRLPPQVGDSEDAAAGGGRKLKDAEGPAEHADPERTELEMILARIQAVYRKYGELENEVSHVVPPLWLPPLPEDLDLAELLVRAKFHAADGDSARSGNREGVPIGLWDRPETVRQGVVFLDYKKGHHFICGMPASGKTMLLHTYLYLLKRQVNVDALPQIIILDYGGGTKKAAWMEEAVYTAGETTETRETLAFLGRRAKSASTDADRENDLPVRDVLLVIDGLGNLLEELGYTVMTELAAILKFGAANGIYLILTANEVSQKGMPRGWLGYLQAPLCLRMQDDYQYAELLAKPQWKGAKITRAGHGYVRTDTGIAAFVAAHLTEGLPSSLS